MIPEHPSEANLAMARAKRGQPQSLRLRVLVAGVYWVVAGMYLAVAFFRHHVYRGGPGFQWGMAGAWVLIALLWTVPVFLQRRADSTNQHSMFPHVTLQEEPEPPDDGEGGKSQGA